MKLGPAAMEALRAEVSGMLHSGEELVVAGAIALAVTEQLLEEKKDKLEAHFSPSFLRDARCLKEKFGAGDLRENRKEAEEGCCKDGEIWKAAEKAGASCLIEVGEDGFLAALWKMAEASEVGLHVDLRKVPIRQETIEMCECFDVNPYEAPSGNCILAGFPNAYAFIEECEKRGIPAVLIGTVNSEKARLLYSGETCRYLDRPKKKMGN